MLLYTTYTEDYVKEMYSKIGIIQPGQLNFNNIASALNVTVFYWPNSSQALFQQNELYIFLNEALSPQQQWQDFCHELSHVLFHAGRQRSLPPSFIKYQEEKANQFMYHAAVPTFMLHELQLEDATKCNVQLVQQLFNVEQDFAYKRLTQYINRKRDMLNWHTYNTTNLVHLV